MNANKKINIIIIVLMAIYFIVMFNYLKLQPVNDDAFFSKALVGNSIYEFLSTRYMIWSGRVTIDALLALTITHAIVWKMMIPSSVILLCLSSSRLITGKFSLIESSVMMLMVILISFPINFESIYWVTGAYNYILPFSLFAYGLSVFFQEKPKNIEKIASLASLFVSCFNEQSAFFTVIIFATVLLIKKTTITRFRVSMVILSVFLFLIIILAPGNYQRSIAETLNWLPEFKDYNLINKLMFGVDRLNLISIIPENIPLLILSFALVFKVLKRNKKEVTTIFSSLIVTSWIVIYIFASLYPQLMSKGFLHWNVAQSNFPNITKFSSISTFISLSITLFFMVSLVYISSLFVTGFNNSLIVPSCLLVGMASVMMLSFSPTVYASSYRTLFLFEICICLAVTKCTHDFSIRFRR